MNILSFKKVQIALAALFILTLHTLNGMQVEQEKLLKLQAEELSEEAIQWLGLQLKLQIKGKEVTLALSDEESTTYEPFGKLIQDKLDEGEPYELGVATEGTTNYFIDGDSLKQWFTKNKTNPATGEPITADNISYITITELPKPQLAPAEAAQLPKAEQKQPAIEKPVAVPSAVKPPIEKQPVPAVKQPALEKAAPRAVVKPQLSENDLWLGPLLGKASLNDVDEMTRRPLRERINVAFTQSPLYILAVRKEDTKNVYYDAFRLNEYLNTHAIMHERRAVNPDNIYYFAITKPFLAKREPQFLGTLSETLLSDDERERTFWIDFFRLYKAKITPTSKAETAALALDLGKHRLAELLLREYFFEKLQGYIRPLYLKEMLHDYNRMLELLQGADLNDSELVATQNFFKDEKQQEFFNVWSQALAQVKEDDVYFGYAAEPVRAFRAEEAAEIPFAASRASLLERGWFVPRAEEAAVPPAWHAAFAAASSSAPSSAAAAASSPAPAPAIPARPAVKPKAPEIADHLSVQAFFPAQFIRSGTPTNRSRLLEQKYKTYYNTLASMDRTFSVIPFNPEKYKLGITGYTIFPDLKRIDKETMQRTVDNALKNAFTKAVKEIGRRQLTLPLIGMYKAGPFIAAEFKSTDMFKHFAKLLDMHFRQDSAILPLFESGILYSLRPHYKTFKPLLYVARITQTALPAATEFFTLIEDKEGDANFFITADRELNISSQWRI